MLAQAKRPILSSVELSPGLAQALGNIALGWYSDALSESETVQEIESALRSHGAEDMLVPEDDWPSAHS
jgi:hypothetical protein